jgi:hypothetical protein
MNGSHNMYRTWLLALCSVVSVCVLQMQIIGYEKTRYEAKLPQAQKRYGYTSKGKLHPFLHATLLMSFQQNFHILQLVFYTTVFLYILSSLLASFLFSFPCLRAFFTPQCE